MTQVTPKAARYPKSHLMAASGVAAMLSLALLVFPTQDVEAKKTFLDLDLELSGDYRQDEDAEDIRPAKSPFAQVDEGKSTEATLDKGLQRITVANGDTLSTVFAQVGLGASVLHAALASSKEARQFTRLKVGQVLEFRLDEQGELSSLHSKLSDLESISLTNNGKGFSFKRDLIKPETRTRYARGNIDSPCSAAPRKLGCRID